MFRIAAAILLLSATAASAGAGNDFCEAIKTQHVACLNEAGQRTGGDYVRKCPNAISAVDSAYQSAKQRASGDLERQIDTAMELWKGISAKPLPQIGETPEAFMARNKSEIGDVQSACAKLQALD